MNNRRLKFFLIFLVSFVLVACDGRQEQLTNPDASQIKKPGSALAPVNVEITIVDKHVIPGIKRGLTVRLDKKISKKVLIDVAHKLKESDPNNYERTLINYFLPGMTMDAGSWASTNFNPELEVRISGLSIEQEGSLMSHPKPATNGIHGIWIDELSNRRITIFSNKGGLFLEQLYTDGSSGIVELKSEIEDGVSMFIEIGGHESDPPYFIGPDGNLYLPTPDGPLAVGIKKRNPSLPLHNNKYKDPLKTLGR